MEVAGVAEGDDQRGTTTEKMFDSVGDRRRGKNETKDFVVCLVSMSFLSCQHAFACLFAYIDGLGICAHTCRVRVRVRVFFFSRGAGRRGDVLLFIF
jgi:hypothetical protein